MIGNKGFWIEVKWASKPTNILEGDNDPPGDKWQIKRREEAGSNVAIVISAKCTTSLFSLKQHYTVQNNVLTKIMDQGDLPCSYLQTQYAPTEGMYINVHCRHICNLVKDS